MSANLRLMVSDHERLEMAVGVLMSSTEWLSDTWGVTLDCTKICSEMCNAIASGDSAEAGNILESALKRVARDQAKKKLGIP